MSNSSEVGMIANLSPAEIVTELDKYIIGQKEAKRAVAIALRNRWRRQRVGKEMRDEIHPKNILMIGPTGVGKTEIARRLARLAKAPFVKVEATKYTEVGYVGKDVESMVRDLVDIAVNMIKEEELQGVQEKAKMAAEERILDILVPYSAPPVTNEAITELEVENSTRDKFREMLHRGELDDREVEIKAQQKQGGMEVFAIPGMEGMEHNIKDMLDNVMPKKKRNRKLKVTEALKVLQEEEAQKLVDMDSVIPRAIDRAENQGIIFLDEMDKIADSNEPNRSGGVSREGVQRDLLPIVEGSAVNTKHGVVKTDHILFIAAGAFHQVKPSDLVPELQGRFPIRVELNSLTTEDFVRILSEPQNSLPKQYTSLMRTEQVDLDFSPDAIQALADIASGVNEKMENIGARRLHTIMERVLDEISFSATDIPGQKVEVTAEYVNKRINDLIKDSDLSRYIL